jgi:hypothetical protein
MALRTHGHPRVIHSVLDSTASKCQRMACGVVASTDRTRTSGLAIPRAALSFSAAVTSVVSAYSSMSAAQPEVVSGRARYSFVVRTRSDTDGGICDETTAVKNRLSLTIVRNGRAIWKDVERKYDTGSQTRLPKNS